MFKFIIATLLVFYTTNFISGDPNCPEPDCTTVRCDINGTAQTCLDANMAYVLKDKCTCCGKCAEIKDVVDPAVLQCKPTIDCRVVRCIRDYPDNCSANQVLIPADGKCYCCPKCVNRKRKCIHK